MVFALSYCDSYLYSSFISSKYTEKRMKVTRLMPLIYPFICYFVQKRLFGGKSYFVEKRLSV
ncbi:hypothetical protein M080_8087 [Bacteroides fragilis str. 3397 T10]|nr:hypothetical protein M080_8087 [Bacteroides fragilis str. 3397 T10]